MTHLIKLAQPHGVFRDPVNNLHLHYYNPTGNVGTVSENILSGLKYKTIVDVHGTIPMESAEESAGDLVVDITEDQALTPVVEAVPQVIEPIEAVFNEEVIEDKGIAIESLNKEELLSFLKENDITQKELGISSKSSEEKIREALVAHLEKEADQDGEEA